MIVRCGRCDRQLFAPAGALGECPGCGAAVAASAGSASADPRSAIASTPELLAATPERTANPQASQDTPHYVGWFASRANNGWQALDESEESRWRSGWIWWIVAAAAGLALIGATGYGYFMLRGRSAALAASAPAGGAQLGATRWEYKLSSPSAATLSTRLALEGAQGWELVFAHSTASPESQYDLIFKRPVAGELAPAAASPTTGIPMTGETASTKAAGPAASDVGAKLKKSDLRKLDP